MLLSELFSAYMQKSMWWKQEQHFRHIISLFTMYLYENVWASWMGGYCMFYAWHNIIICQRKLFTFEKYVFLISFKPV